MDDEKRLVLLQAERARIREAMLAEAKNIDRPGLSHGHTIENRAAAVALRDFARRLEEDPDAPLRCPEHSDLRPAPCGNPVTHRLWNGDGWTYRCGRCIRFFLNGHPEKVPLS